MKSYTDLEQSKVLTEILPIESADMFYADGERPAVWNNKDENLDNEDIPCWSLAALLEIIPKHIKEFNVLRIDIADKDFSIWYDEIGFGVNNELPDITTESPIDACYEIILKLNKEGLL